MKEVNSKWIPKVGEKVKLVNSGENWCSTRNNERLSMDEILQQFPIVEVTKVFGSIESGDIEIKFKNSGNWTWALRNGHFEPYEEVKVKKPKKENLKYLVSFLKEAGIK